MPISVVVGGQYGSEGKGKVAYLLAKEMGAAAAVRIGGPNSGHTVVSEAGESMIFRQLPTAALIPSVHCALGAGSYIDVDLLLGEIDRVGLPAARLSIDPNAMILTSDDRRTEFGLRLQERVGSTQSGVGACIIRRINRDEGVTLARDEMRLRPYVRPVIPFLSELIGKEARILIEGTQGFGLSLLHAADYPSVTSRDTTASGFLSEVGLSPLDVDDIVLVMRAFPIRVPGNSGPLAEEVTWERVTELSGSSVPIAEYTSVTKVLRRVARFEPTVVREAIMVNQPTRLVLNHLDYFDVATRATNVPSDRAIAAVRGIESRIGRRVDLYGFGPSSMVLAGTHRELALESLVGVA